jgi:hypothetical protein
VVVVVHRTVLGRKIESLFLILFTSSIVLYWFRFVILSSRFLVQWLLFIVAASSFDINSDYLTSLKEFPMTAYDRRIRK